jgi:homoserine O-acetyltransferase
MSSFQVFTYNHAFTLQSGDTLPQLHLAYHTWGKLNEDKSNVVWVFHALTANSNATDWWHGLVGEGYLFDPAQYFIVCVNMPGSCYGSIGPLDVNPATGQPYYHAFPWFTTRDMVRAYDLLRQHLNIQKIHIGVGGSMGGQQLLEWAIEQPALFGYIFPIATNAQHSQWGRAFNESQRWCIESDTSWKEHHEAAGLEGMKVARSVALLSYRNYESYESTHKGEAGNAITYQRYQGEKLAKRFNAFSYYFLSKSMDAHDVGRDRGDVLDALKNIQAQTLVISIKTDLLFPVKDQEFLAEHIPGGELAVIHSHYGHDGFLLEFEKLGQIIAAFIRRQQALQPQADTLLIS